MISWMSTSYVRFTIILLLIFCIGCVPHAYQHLQKTNKNNTIQTTYQQFNYSQDENISLIPYDDSYNIKNEYYLPHPVYYEPFDNDINIYYQNRTVNKKQFNNKTLSKGIWHVIKKGETLYRISKQYNTTVEAICEANNIKDFTTIKVGQSIFIPSNATIKNSPSKKSCTASIPSKELKSNFSFIWPVSSVITYTHDHRGVRPLGIIIKSKPKSRVVASAPGTIAKIGVMRGFGNFVVIMHKKDLYTVYSKLDAINVKEGQAVQKGATIGFLSDSNPSLHFQINHSGKPLDPLQYLAQK